MRRSKAPSVLNSRAKFTPPIAKKPRLDSENEQTGKCPVASKTDEKATPTDRIKTPSLLDLMRDPGKIQLPQPAPAFGSGPTDLKLNVVFSPSVRDNAGEGKCVAPTTVETVVSVPTLISKSRSPVLSSPKPSSASVTTESSKEWEGSLFFSCVYAKQSTRKHKKWEGDGVLIVKGKSVTLKDSEGKVVGQTSMKMSDLEALGDGDRIFVGSKEVELGEPISIHDFLVGRCFDSGGGASGMSSLTSGSSQLTTISTPSAVGVKPFKNPMVNRNLQSNIRTNGVVSAPSSHVSAKIYQPLYDANAPDAFVLPRPPADHVRINNAGNLPVTDVVVDPAIARCLRPHQKKGVVFLYQRIMGMNTDVTGFGAVLADAMGLGKTLQCIALIWALLKHGPYGNKPILKRVIIVTPGSLVKNWSREFNKWLGTQKLNVYMVGTQNQNERRAEDYHKFTSVCPVLIVSYEMFNRTAQSLKSVQFDLLICDEGHRLKNTSTQTWKLLTTCVETRRRIVLTGTPLQNDLQELYAIAEFCNPGQLGTVHSFRRVYEEPISRSRQPDASREERSLGEARASALQRLISGFTLRRTEEVNEAYLPPKEEITVFCRPSSFQNHAYQRLLESRFVVSAIQSDNPSSHFACIAALKKLCNHPSLLSKTDSKSEFQREIVSLLPNAQNTKLEESGKLRVLIRLLERLHQRGKENKRVEKIVLVSNWTSTLDVFESVCNVRGFRFLRLDGQTPIAKRQSLVDRFNSKYGGEDQETVFLLSSKAGGVGLNLIGASTLVLFDIDWNPANDLQAMARVWRDGQKRVVRIYRLLTTGTIEEKIFQRQISKQGLSGAVVDSKDLHTGGKTVHFSNEDLRDLFVFDSRTASSTHDLLRCRCLDDEDDAKDGNRGVGNDEDVDLVDDRKCQIFKTESASNKFQGISELMEWRHVATPFDDDFDDELLIESQDDISMIFRNVAQKA